MTANIDRHIPDLVSITEAAEILGITRAAVHLRIQAGQLAARQAGTTWVMRRVVVERARGDAPETALSAADRAKI